MNVRDAMTAHPQTIPPETPIQDAAERMRHGRFRHLPVTEDIHLVGIVTERDLHVHDGPDAAMQRNRPVRAVMTREVISVAPDDPIEQAARLMLENKVGCLPVLENGQLAGIITESDLFRAFVDVLGVLEPGTRVQIHAEDLAVTLARVAEVARSRSARIISVVSDSGAGRGRPGLVVRFGTVMLAPLLTALREAGVEVDAPNPDWGA